MYCPGAKSEPVKVSVGYYSVGGSGPTTRTGQVYSSSLHAVGVRPIAPRRLILKVPCAAQPNEGTKTDRWPHAKFST